MFFADFNAQDNCGSQFQGPLWNTMPRPFVNHNTKAICRSQCQGPFWATCQSHFCIIMPRPLVDQIPRPSVDHNAKVLSGAHASHLWITMPRPFVVQDTNVMCWSQYQGPFRATCHSHLCIIMPKAICGSQYQSHLSITMQSSFLGHMPNKNIVE